MKIAVCHYRLKKKKKKNHHNEPKTQQSLEDFCSS